MTDEEIQRKAEGFSGWYHSIRLTPTFTTKSYHDIGYQWDMVRLARSHIGYAGKAVLDVGTMDGMWAFEAEKLGASRVVTIDSGQGGNETQQRHIFAKEVLNSKVVSHTADVQERLTHIGYDFDIIQYLGVLYHVQNPIRSLQMLRQVVDDNGVMLLETAVWESQDPAPLARFNSDLGVYNDSSTFWVPNFQCLIAWLQMTGWQPNLDSSKSVRATNSWRHCLICRPANGSIHKPEGEPYQPA